MMDAYITDIDSIDAARALKILCLYLAQKPEPSEPHKELGFASCKSAFDVLGKKFGRPPNTVKNYRDHFDAYTDSRRAGWHQRELSISDKEILEQYAAVPRNDFLKIAQYILQKDWSGVGADEVSNIFDYINLVDLNPLKPQDSLVTNPVIGDFALPEQAILLLEEKLGKEIYKFNRYSGHLYNKTSRNYCIFSNQYFFYMLKLKKFALELYKYTEIIDSNRDKIAELINANGITSEDIEKSLNYDEKFIENFGRHNIDLLSKFLGSDRERWGHKGKQIINKPRNLYIVRTGDDFFGSEVLSIINIPNSSSGAFGDLIYSICQVEGLFDELESLLTHEPSSLRVKGGKNILYYGAPGTGKSYAASKDAGEDQDCVFRTLFHPDMQNSDFFGTLKPAIDKNGQPIYKFREGPFAKALVYARDNPSKRVYLIIEELNRAMAAAVFGELFQLLDRDADGTSEYSVDAPSDEFAEWYGAKKIKLPSNLWILATMNSADQGVYPLDTAFRRRWRQIYIPIDYSIAPKDSVRVSTLKNPDAMIPWPAFVERLNKFLTAKIDIAEDRLIGPRFLNEPELEDGTMPGKLLIYLWDDLLRHHGRHTLFTTTVKTYGELDRANSERKPIFNQAFLDALELDPSET